MPIITSQNWDGVVAPAIPAGWSVSTGLVTTSAAQTSSPNALGSASTTYSGTAAALWGTPDTNAGNVIVQSSLYFAAGSLDRWGLFARANKSPLISSSMFYALWLQNGASPTLSITLTDHQDESILTGTPVTIGTSITGGWYTAWFTLSGTSLQGSLQRKLDGYWLTPGGGWQASQAVAINAADGSLVSSGSAGLLLDGTLSGTMYSDDFVLSTAATPVPVTVGPVALTGSGTASSATTAFAWSLAATKLTAAGLLSSATTSFDTVLGVSKFSGSGLLNAAIAGIGASTTTTSFVGSSTLNTSTVLRAWTAVAGPNLATGTLGSPGISAARTLSASVFAVAGTLAAASPSYAINTIAGPISGSGLITIPATLLGSGVNTTAGPINGLGMTGVPSLALGFVVSSGSLIVGGALGSTAIQTQRTLTVGATAIQGAGALPTPNLWNGPTSVLYNIYRNDGVGGPIDYTSLVATTSATSWTVPGAPGLAYPGDWKFGVRAFGIANGLEEKNLDAAVELNLDPLGADVSGRPPAPSAPRAIPRAAGVIRVEWGYHLMERTRLPQGFRIYAGVGTSPDYTTPMATSAYVLGRTSYQADLSGFATGTTYSIGVRAFNRSGEETNLSTVVAISDATGPGAVDTLTAMPTASQGA